MKALLMAIPIVSIHVSDQHPILSILPHPSNPSSKRVGSACFALLWIPASAGMTGGGGDPSPPSPSFAS